MKYLSTLLIVFFMISCGGEKKSSNSSDKSIKGNWPEIEQIAFLEECEDNLDPDAPWGYCDCALDEFMTAYPDINDAEEAFMSMSMNDMMNMVEPCL